MTHSEDHRRLVLRVNELFHDMEGKEYENVHPEIFAREVDRWDRLARSFLKNLSHPLTAVDVGSGTGFVGMRLLPWLRKDDTLICADISEQMLSVCRATFAGKRPDLTVKTVKMTDETLDIPDASADIITMNSVLHHVPDTRRFLNDLNRILKPGGLLFIAHEPNARFFSSAVLFGQSQLIHSIIRLLSRTKPAQRQKHDAQLDALNAQLMQEGLITEPLSYGDRSKLIDVHSPTAGGIRKNEGFDPLRVLDGLPFTVRHIESYNHLSKLSGKYPALRWYESFLKMIAPRTGATFFLIAQKNKAQA